MHRADPGPGDAPRLFPLRLCEVLESEYVALRDLLPVAPDWLLRPEDICQEELFSRLRASSPHPALTPAYAVRERLEKEDAKILAPSPGNREQGERLLELLNKLLQESADLYDHRILGRDEEAFRLAELRRRVRQIGKDEQVLLNRLLLEAAFPAETVRRADMARQSRLFREIHRQKGPEEIYTALCLSGGGIRSGAFALGVLQGLARCGILEKFDFLSTVSGGGYVGSWLSTWIHRHPRGLAGVAEEMKGRASRAGGSLGAEPGPIRFLRSYSHFLNPRAGLFSVDTWTWIGIYLRNLLLNWLIIIPALLLLLMLPRIFGVFMWEMELPTRASFSTLFLLASLAGIISLVCITISRPSLRDVSPQAGGATRTSAPGPFGFRVGHADRRGSVLLAGILPFMLFCISASLLAWGGYPTTYPREGEAGWFPAWMPMDLLSDLSRAGLDNMVIWGESLLLLAWLVSMAVLPERDWGKRLKELFVMLLAGLVTWWLIAELLHFARDISTKPESVFRFYSLVYDWAHLYAVLAVPILSLAASAGMTIFIGVVSKFNWIEDEDREWWGRFGAWILVINVAWAALAAVAIFGPLLLLLFPAESLVLGGISGLVALLFGKSSLTAATVEKSLPAGAGNVKSLFGATGTNTIAALSAVFLAAFLALLSLVVSALLIELVVWLDFREKFWINEIAPLSQLSAAAFLQLHLDLVHEAPLALILCAALILLLVVLLADRLINLNKFSLHAAYRIRIIRAFLGASRQEVRQPNPFTGFDPLDNVPMHELQPGLLRDGDFRNLGGFVGKLHQALVSKNYDTPAGALVKIMCSPQRDRSGVLKSRLQSHDPDEPVLKSLQRELLESMNRVLQTVRLSEVRAFQPTDYRTVQRTAWYADRGNLIFSNRHLIDIAFPEDIRAYQFPPPPPRKLMHLINLTLNLVRGRNLAWQERKAAPFSVSPLHSGSYYLGYRPSRDYGGENGISLGTAVAISGAAVSPAMGYSSSPVTALLLTLFNVRLGWWLGNPGTQGYDTYREAGPRFSFLSMVSEALGMTDDRSSYVYLSDGGHFENLGLFEMVLRRCRLIVVCDATADPDYRFSDLGNAVRKIRIDLGIPIVFPAMPIRKYVPGDDGGRYCAIGRICYSSADGEDAPDGVLVYFKPVLCGGEPQDIRQFAAQFPTFPQESTLDQFFGESQFESYCHLGKVAVDAVLGEGPLKEQHWVQDLIHRVKAHGRQAGSREGGMKRSRVAISAGAPPRSRRRGRPMP